jgi:hypothetical protein
MKKILFLLTVVVMMANSASGIIVFDMQEASWDDNNTNAVVDAGDDINLQIVLASPYITDAYNFGVSVSTTGTATGTLNDNAGAVQHISGGVMYSYSGIASNAISSVKDITFGTWDATSADQDMVWDFYVTLGGGAGTVTVDLGLNETTRYKTSGGSWINTDDDNEVGDLVIDVVPEPMTIALLGLGGLFLRRRRA